MKLSEFKQSISDRWNLLKLNIKLTFQKETAYVGNNWSSLASTTVYTISILLFVDIIYSKVNTLAGYSKNEMLFYFFIAQLVFYGNWSFNLKNIYELVADVNKGNLDLLLVKPVPSLFFVSTRNVSLLSTLTDALAPTLAIAVSINWSALNLHFLNLLVGLLIYVCGLTAANAFQFMSGLLVFWLGESQNVVDFTFNLTSSSGTLIPLEGYGNKLRIILSTVIPILIAAGFTTSAILGKSNAEILLLWSLIVAIVATYLRAKLWQYALKNYTSASS